MSKIVFTTLANLQSESTAVQTINANFAALAAVFDNTFSRDGTTPNSMSATVDMNSNKIINLPVPLTNSEPLRLGDVGGILPSNIATAGASAAAAAASATAAAASATAAAGFVGSATSAPKWTTGRTITLSGDVTGTSPTWDGSTNLAFTGLTIAAGAVTSAKMAANAAANNLGFTPLNNQGDNIGGDLHLSFTASALLPNSVGFRGIPVNNQNANYTFVIDDGGRMVRHNDGNPYTWTINPIATTAFPIGHAIGIRNAGSGVITLNPGVGVTLRKAGTSTTGAVSVAQWGYGALVMEDNNVWVISGVGLT